jgi:hypothetical protein
MADGRSVPISLFLPGGPPTLAEPSRVIDEAAAAAGRHPSDVRRIVTFPGRFSPSPGGLLDGPPAQWAEELADMTLRYGVGAFVLGSDDAAMIERFAAEVVPATRELVAPARRAAVTARAKSGARWTQHRHRSTTPSPRSLAEVAVRPGDPAYAQLASTYFRRGAPGIVLRRASPAHAPGHPEHRAPRRRCRGTDL